MYGSGSTQACLPYICLLFSGFLNVCHFTCIWPRALKLGCITNIDMLFLVMGFICLFYENKFMLISGRHISNRSIGGVHIAKHSSCFCKFYVYFEQRNMAVKGSRYVEEMSQEKEIWKTFPNKQLETIGVTKHFKCS